MNSFSLKALIGLLCVLSVFAVSAHYVLGELTGNPTRMRLYRMFHEKEYETIAKELLGVKTFQMLRVRDGIFPGEESVNSCFKESKTGAWKCYLSNRGDVIAFESLSQVLVYVGVSDQVVTSVEHFMRKYHIGALSVNHNENYVDFMDKGVGVRYYIAPAQSGFTPDEMHEIVQPLNNQWFYFTTDWN
jgi:hypothetical protein